MKCYIVRDLLPDYEEGLLSPEVKAEIENHLRTCADCRAYRKTLLTSKTTEDRNKSISDKESGKADMEFLRKMRRQIRGKYIKAVIAAAAIVALVFIFLFQFRIVRPFDKKNMTAENYQLALMKNSNGKNQWTDLDQLDFQTTESVLKGEDKTMDFVQVVRQNGNNTEEIDSIGRTVTMNGKKVRLIYYCYWDSLWNDMTSKDTQSANRWESNASIEDGEELYQSYHEAEERKIYYLPKANLSRYEGLSDENFEKLAKDAVLVWDGNV